MKYKIGGVLSLLVGCFLILYSFSFIFVVAPRSWELHRSLNLSTSPVVLFVFLNIFILVVGIVNLVFSVKLFFSKTVDKDRDLVIAAVILFVSFGLIGISTLLSVLSTVASIYNL